MGKSGWMSRLLVKTSNAEEAKIRYVTMRNVFDI